MTISKSLKDFVTLAYVIPYLLFLTVLILIFGYKIFSPADAIEFASNLTIGQIGSGTLLFAVTYLVAVLLQHVIPRSAKEIVVFWRLRNRLPGTRAFSQFAKQDARVDLDALMGVGGDPDASPEEQNRVWYRLYQTVANEPSVLQAHRRYLGFRDLAATVVLTAPLVVFAIYHLSGQGSLALYLSGSILLIYILTVVAARNSAAELVCNVLALKS